MRTDADKFTEQGLSNILWAAAKVGLNKHQIRPIVHAVVERLRSAPGEFEVQGLRSICWAASWMMENMENEADVVPLQEELFRLGYEARQP
eukprot:3335710-Amphidinium_carterae.1